MRGGWHIIIGIVQLSKKSVTRDVKMIVSITTTFMRGYVPVTRGMVVTGTGIMDNNVVLIVAMKKKLLAQLNIIQSQMGQQDNVLDVPTHIMFQMDIAAEHEKIG
jgi:hypothetical protein